MITQKQLKERLSYNPVTGDFIWLKLKAGATKIGDVAGTASGYGYIIISIGGYGYIAHRLAWLYVHGVWPKNQIDHINHVRSDNRICNLRDVTRKENQKNRSITKTSVTGVNGVTWHKRDEVWQSRINTQEKEVSLGYFSDRFEAICARKSAERKHGYHENTNS